MDLHNRAPQNVHQRKKERKKVKKLRTRKKRKNEKERKKERKEGRKGLVEAKREEDKNKQKNKNKQKRRIALQTRLLIKTPQERTLNKHSEILLRRKKSHKNGAATSDTYINKVRFFSVHLSRCAYRMINL